MNQPQKSCNDMPEHDVSFPGKESAGADMNKRKATNAEGGDAAKKRNSCDELDSDGEDEDNNSSSGGNGNSGICGVSGINKDNPYWQSSEAADLFGFDRGTDVYNGLKQLIETFEFVMNSKTQIWHYADCGEGEWIIPVDIVQLGKDKTSLTKEDREDLWLKCIYLRMAYVTALKEMNRISTWAECCDKAYSRIFSTGFGIQFTDRSGRTIEEWNRDFRVNHKFTISNQP